MRNFGLFLVTISVVSAVTALLLRTPASLALNEHHVQLWVLVEAIAFLVFIMGILIATRAPHSQGL
jgi:ABC-type spermidine/putrescine transport system permease subunit II